MVCAGRHAIDAPRVLDLRKVQTWNDPFPAIPPPLIYRVCHESKEETIQVYDAYHSATPERVGGYHIKTRWVRFDQDIIHIKPMSEGCGTDIISLSDRFTRAGLANSFIHQWGGIANTTTNFGSDKWLNRPERFNEITYLAICRDLLHHLPDDYEPFIRHFLPNLMVLIVLIDEDIDIDTEWKIWDLEYGRYEKKIHETLRTDANPHAIPRLDFAKKTKGPFKQVKLNIDYRMDIEYEMRKRFTKEEGDYNVRIYTGIIVQMEGAIGRRTGFPGLSLFIFHLMLTPKPVLVVYCTSSPRSGCVYPRGCDYW